MFNFEGPGAGRCAPGPENSHKGKGNASCGGIAQLGEHLLCKQGVKGSNPFISIRCFALFAKQKVQKHRIQGDGKAVESDIPP